MSNTRNLLAAALLASAGNAVAASSVDLAVKGSITPSACDMTLSNDGHFELGKISAKDLSKGQPTSLPEQFAQLTVTCDAATLVAIESKDNRAGSAYFDEANKFGLGFINTNQKLGDLSLMLVSPVADGNKAYGLHSMDGGLSWITGGRFKPGSLMSVYTALPVTPIPVQEINSKLRIMATIAPTDRLNLDNEVPIDGSISLTLRYL